MKSVDDMKSIQLDYTSEFAKEILPHILNLERGIETGRLKRSFKFLREWDGVEHADSEATLIFHAIMRNLVINIYGDELSLLGQNYLDAYVGLKYLVDRRLRQVFTNGKSSWIDDITTKNKIETFNEILYKSINEGCNEIEKMYGSNWTNWKWGDAHAVTHRHTLSGVKLLDWLFDLNVGPFRSGGSDKTPNAGGYSINNPYFQTSGASMRRIVDFDNLNETQFILPTGQSGLSNSPHYKDQAYLYHRGEYRTTWFDEKHIRSSMEFRHLEFYPE